MNSIIKNFTIEDYPSAFKLWQTDDNVGLSSADVRENIEIFIKRNPGLSKVAIDNGNVVATLLCGHDGRRGYLYHLFVDKRQRRQHLGSKLVEACLNSLKEFKNVISLPSIEMNWARSFGLIHLGKKEAI